MRKHYACWLLQNRVTASAERLAFYCGGKADTFRKFLTLYRHGECATWRTGWQPTEAQMNALPVAPVPHKCCASGVHRRFFDMAGEEDLEPRDKLPAALIEAIRLGKIK